MKSWAHTYTAGSLLGTVLIVAALVAFVPLVSLNAPDEWPTPSLGLVGGGGESDVGVGIAVVAAAKHSGTGGLNPNPVDGSTAAVGAAIGTAPVSGETYTGRPGGAPAGAPAKGTVAISPVSVEVARDPGSPTSEGAGADVPLPNPPETDGAPVPAAIDGGADDVRNGETPPAPPIDAGAPEPQPPERPESVPPPPPGSSTGGGDVPGCPEGGDEGEAAQAEGATPDHY
jgi:hypothetical protein